MNNPLDKIQNWSERATQANYCASKLAKNCGVSLKTLQRHFLKKMGKSPKKWLLEQRRQLAGKLLQNGSSVKETAGLLNYKHQNHLTNEFTKHLGYCPTNKTAPLPPPNQ